MRAAATKCPDWRGALKRRFRWLKLRFEWGRYCYIVNQFGEDREVWFEWENP